MNPTAPKIIPVLIGADLNCYNVARAFHEAYGVISHAFGRYAIGATKSSRIVRFTEVSDLDNDNRFLQTMAAFAASHKTENNALILLGCTDDYANLIARNKEKLSGNFIVPYNDASIMELLSSKERFYQYCDTYGISHPATKVLLRVPASLASLSDSVLGFPYPIIIKPSNSTLYWKHPFPNMEKVYTADTPEKAMKILENIFGSGYNDSVILQDRIPGDDSCMYVLTTYSGKDGRVHMMCLGHVLLEEHTPKGRGNHAAILTESRPEVAEPLRRMLDSISYTGFANFDLKYDRRDGTWRAFEINLRQGRSNYYVTASGENIARYVVEDYVTDSLTAEIKTANRPILWTAIPKGVVRRYVKDSVCLAEAEKRIRSKQHFASLWYPYDLRFNPRRLFYVLAHSLNHFRKYRKYYSDHGEVSFSSSQSG